MPQVPVPATVYPGASDSSEFNTGVRDVLRFLLNKPMVELKQSTTQTLAASTFTAITFTAEDLDDNPDGSDNHSTSSNTSRFTAVYPGWYELTGGVAFAVSGTGQRGCHWRKNGVIIDASANWIQSPTAGGGTSVTAQPRGVYLDIGDYVELFAWQGSGGSLDTFSSTYDMCHMGVAWARLAA